VLYQAWCSISLLLLAIGKSERHSANSNVVRRPAEGAVEPVVEALLQGGHLWPKGQALFRLQQGRMPGHVERERRDPVHFAILADLLAFP